jgi:NADH-quinone oxidoreductase subunit M
MLVLLFILIPFLAGLGLLFTQNSSQAKIASFFASLLLLGVVWYAMYLPSSHDQLNYSRVWLGSMNSNFSLMLDGIGKVTTLLTAVSFPLIFLATWRNEYKDANQYYALMLLTQAGLMGVFLSTDALLFLLGARAGSNLFSLQQMGRRKKNCGQLQVFHLHFYWISNHADRYYIPV